MKTPDPLLPAPPSHLTGPVKAWSAPVTIPTYLPHAPDKNPMFLERRVYQGSSGKVYPLPFTDRIAEEKIDHTWDALHIENEFLRVMVLPQIGGRIHIALDKTNNYDLIYRQNVIKPALVGLAGPWISGGIEFNWPQHHRPSTFMPTQTYIEEHADGAQTIWCSEHDPMCRMKGMHGVCLHPGKAFIELKVRLYNRTPLTQTFLWWANVATRVHEFYQSFFPPDVTYIADHAKRAMSRYPLCEGRYYGVDYAARAKHGVPQEETPRQYIPRPQDNSAFRVPHSAFPNDLSWYANIPVPTSYMAMGSKEDFFGGYDHRARAGIVHIANHHIAPGKKQWTWGNHEFGYAWDRNLTDAEGDDGSEGGEGEYAPYIEIMAGVYTDNQPDFSFLAPGETKTFSQFWYPIQEIGPAQHANLNAAVSLRVEKAAAHIGVCVSQAYPNATVSLETAGQVIATFTRDLAPGRPLVETVSLPRLTRYHVLRVVVADAANATVIAYQPRDRPETAVPAAAAEPPLPRDIASADELYITGLHLEQYRHATRDPVMYWREALRRDPLDCRCNNALGLYHLRRGELDLAQKHFRAAITRLTTRNPNPYDGEPHYNLGLTLRFLRHYDDAYDAFYKSAWNAAWQGPAYHALAEIDCRRKNFPQALDHLTRALKLNADNLRARNLKVIALRQLARHEEAQSFLDQTLALDPLDAWAAELSGDHPADPQTALDIALDLCRAGFYDDANTLLATVPPEPGNGVTPLLFYYRAYCADQLGDATLAKNFRGQAAAADPAYCFPSRLEDMLILQAAAAANPRDARAPYYLGNIFYDRRRHRDAITQWQKAARLDPKFPIVWRNLGIAYFNILGDARKAADAYARARRANPRDARLLYEQDQLAKRLGRAPQARLVELEKNRALVDQRDDLSIELCALYNQTGQYEKARAILTTRKFQPWEGGEGQTLEQHVRTHLAMGREELSKAGCHAFVAAKDPGKTHDRPTAAKACEGHAATAHPTRALEHFQLALATPQNLGESRHLLANPADIHYHLGLARAAAGDTPAAKEHWRRAAEFQGDFQQMAVQPFSEMTYYQIKSLQRLGRKPKARKLAMQLLAYAKKLFKTPATIDYFATSLPTMLIFEDDLTKRQQTTALFLEAQALLCLGKVAPARRLLAQVLRRDPNHAMAADLVAELNLTKMRTKPVASGDVGTFQ